MDICYELLYIVFSFRDYLLLFLNCIIIIVRIHGHSYKASPLYSLLFSKS